MTGLLLNARMNAIAVLASSRLCQVSFLIWADLVYAFNGRNSYITFFVLFPIFAHGMALWKPE